MIHQVSCDHHVLFLSKTQNSCDGLGFDSRVPLRLSNVDVVGYREAIQSYGSSSECHKYYFTILIRFEMGKCFSPLFQRHGAVDTDEVSGFEILEE